MKGDTRNLAKHLRANMTLPEMLVWGGLKHRDKGCPIFRRQVPIGHYIVDFYCAKAKLVIEVDGIARSLGDQSIRDEHRDVWLTSKGLLVVRYDAKSVLDDTGDITDGIIRLARDRIDHITPSICPDIHQVK